MSQFSQKMGIMQIWDNYWLIVCLSLVVKVKNNDHIYILNWKLGNSSEKKSILPPTELKICERREQVSNCVHQDSLGYTIITNNSKNLNAFETMNLFLSHTVDLPAASQRSQSDCRTQTNRVATLWIGCRHPTMGCSCYRRQILGLGWFGDLAK